MRKLAIAAAVMLCSAPAHAEWKQYTYTDLGFKKDFPAEPTRTEGTYKAPLAKEMPASILSLTQDDITYKVTVVNFAKRANEGANLALEVASHDTGGDRDTGAANFIVNDFPLWDKGANSVYGVSLTIDRKDDVHVLEDVVFNKGRLYIIQASVPNKSPSRSSFALGRFMDTIQFYMKGYGFNYATGHDYPLGDNDPADRDNRPAAANYHPPAGLVSGPLKNGAPQ
jgi:hypothetical protein